jgi:hypothetical protein
MKSYHSILSPLLECKTMPLRECIAQVVFTDHREITTSYVESSGGSTTVLEGGRLRTYTTSDDIVSISHEDRLVYPQLPSGIKTPGRDDYIGWIKATVRSIMNSVNSASVRDHSNALVVSVDMDMVNRTLRLTMTRYWSTLPLFVRQRFLTLLWDVYGKLLVTYNVSMGYYRVSMFMYDDESQPIAYRSVYRSFVEGGLECKYSLHNYN